MSPRRRTRPVSPQPSAPQTSLNLRPISRELKAALDSSRAQQFDRTFVQYIGKLQALHERVQAEARKPGPVATVLREVLTTAGLRLITDG